MQSTSITNHRVEIHQADIANWFSANEGDADTTGMRLLDIKLLNDTALTIGIPVSEAYLDTFLRTIISNLPALGQYEVQILPYAADIVGVITWDA